jgi:hypothetical protein
VYITAEDGLSVLESISFGIAPELGNLKVGREIEADSGRTVERLLGWGQQIPRFARNDKDRGME